MNDVATNDRPDVGTNSAISAASSSSFSDGAAGTWRGALSPNLQIRALVGEARWGWPEGTPRVLTYAFDNSGIAWSDGAKAAYRAALASYAAVVDITFTETTDIARANLRETLADEALLRLNAAFHFFPEPGQTQALGTYSDVSLRQATPDYVARPGVFPFPVLVHELGHALGLSHTHDNDVGLFPGVERSFNRGDNGLNQGVFSVMSYNSGWSGVPGGAGPKGYAAVGPMAFDIAALGTLYKLNGTTGLGASSYVLSEDNRAIQCIWDNGGTDTIRYDGKNHAFISLSAATLENAPDGGGRVSYLRDAGGRSVGSAFTIANGVVIENASGGEGNDTLEGNDAANVLRGNRGNDSLSGGEGNDTLFGGEGDDTLAGGGGDDQIDGGGGNDTAVFRYSRAAYRVTSEADGRVTVRCILQDSGEGTDVLRRISTFSFLDGDYDLASLLASEGTARRGGARGETIEGQAGRDTIEGLGGNDLLRGGGGNDRLDGGEGADTIDGGAGENWIEGGQGEDRVLYKGSRLDYAVSVDRETGLVTVTGRGAARGRTDHLSGVELLSFDDDSLLVRTGTRGVDLATLVHDRTLLSLLAGNDTAEGWSAGGTVDGGDGRDTLKLQDGARYNVDLAAGRAVRTAGRERSAMRLIGIEAVIGGDRADVLAGDSQDNSLSGGAGADRLFGREGSDILSGGAGADTLDGGSGFDLLDGGDGEDVAVFHERFQVYDVRIHPNGGGGCLPAAFLSVRNIWTYEADLLGNVERLQFADQEVRVRWGGAGAETLEGGDGADIIFGGGGDDVIKAGMGQETIDGGDGEDVVVFKQNFATYSIVLNDHYPGCFRVLREGGAGEASISGVERLLFADAAVMMHQGGNADEFIRGGTAPFLAWGGSGNDTLEAGSGPASLMGGFGSDVLRGGIGDDYLRGDEVDEVSSGSNNDRLYGGEGADTLVGGMGDDELDGGGGENTAVFRASAGFYRVTANDDGSVAVQGIGAFANEGRDILRNITWVSFWDERVRLDDLVKAQNWIGTEQGEEHAGSASADSLAGMGGNDTLRGGGGSDTLDGGSGQDMVVFTRSHADYELSFRNSTVQAGPSLLVDDLITGDKTQLINVEVLRFEDAAFQVRLGGSAAEVVEGGDISSLLWGGGGADTVRGGRSADIIDGGWGNDLLEGGDGNDTLDGGESDDADRLFGGQGDDSLLGNLGDDTLDGGEGDDVLCGGEGDDVLDGGSGKNTAVFRSGKYDYRYVPNADGSVTVSALSDNVFDGTDTLRNITWLRFRDGERVALQDLLPRAAWTGTAAGEFFSGGDETDSLAGFAGDDTLDGGGGSDTLLGGEGNDRLRGGAGDDRLLGQEGSDSLDGGTGADTMIGGKGDDLYVVDDVRDVLVERYDEGRDTVQTSLSAYRLGDNFENLAFAGEGAFEGQGNDLDNRLWGAGGADRLRSQGGNDSLYGGAGADTLEGGTGGDWLDGGAGGDRMEGGAGDDTYVVDDLSDRVTEMPGEGLDTVRTSLSSYVLGADLERLVFTSDRDCEGLGNGLDNRLSGSGGADTLRGFGGMDTLLGGDGDDRLDGGEGADLLTGGEGADIFVFRLGESGATAETRDTVADFVSGTDKLDFRAVASTYSSLSWAFDSRTSILSLDLDVDGRADMQVALRGVSGIGARDLLLR